MHAAIQFVLAGTFAVLTLTCDALVPPWGQSNADSARTSASTALGPRNATLQWVAHPEPGDYLSRGDAIVTSSDGLCFVCGRNRVYGMVCAPDYGVMLWSSSQGGGCVFGGRALALTPFRGVVFAPGNALLALSQVSGDFLWSFQFGMEQQVSSNLLVDDAGVIYVGAAPKQLFALHGDTGAVKWQLQDGLVGNVVSASQDVVVATASGVYFAAVDANTGQALWRSPALAQQLDTGVVVAHQTAQLLYFMTKAGAAVGVHSSNGSIAWQCWVGNTSPLVHLLSEALHALILSNSTLAVSVDALTGALLWQTPVSTGGNVGYLALLDSTPRLYVQVSSYDAAHRTDMYVYDFSRSAASLVFHSVNNLTVAATSALGSSQTIVTITQTSFSAAGSGVACYANPVPHPTSPPSPSPTPSQHPSPTTSPSLSASPIPPRQPAVYVSASGTDNSSCTFYSPCATVRYAVEAVANAVPPLDAVIDVFVAPGHYDASSCNITATRPVRITGTDASSTVLDCAYVSGFLAVFAVSVTVSELTVQNGGGSASGGLVVLRSPADAVARAVHVNLHGVVLRGGSTAALTVLSQGPAVSDAYVNMTRCVVDSFVLPDGYVVGLFPGTDEVHPVVGHLLLVDCMFSQNAAPDNGTGTRLAQMTV